MDFGLYNKKAEPRGEHGTLIGNWAEERALKQMTGFARYEDLAIEKKALNQTADRIVTQIGGGGWNAVDDRISVTKATFVDHGTASFTPKIFNQTGNQWMLDANQGQQQTRRDQRSSISLGNDRTPYASTQSSSFLHGSTLIPATQTPLALQQTTRFNPRAFPDNMANGGTRTSKLDRPLTDQ